MKHASLSFALSSLALGAATVLAIATGCSRDSEAAPAKGNTTTTAAPVVASPGTGTGTGSAEVIPVAASNHVDGKNFKLDATPEGDCKAGAPCSVVLRLEAAGDFHINKEYPYKFKAAEGAGIEFQGTDAAGKNVFSKSAGDFKVDGEKIATMRVKFKPTAKGNVTITGTYKMSVCSAKECQLESQEIQATVAVK
ncbi:hypothetical protein [Pendulispora albinea]|uniref:Uncharacterized protein n=1 Tax=Pendulispora albinea TaxID=2741071 RepID=A0ABZ2LKU5_9BACT